MNLLYANPLTQAFHYLLLYFYGTPLSTLHSEFSSGDQTAFEKFQNFPSGKETYSPKDEFDFIIVGGGSAGTVLANRLTEENYTVLLLEAGGHPFPLTHVPGMAMSLLNNPLIDWADRVVPQKRACHALINNGTVFNRGKALGGTSNLNYMFAMRGSPNDYNNWAIESGDPSWKYENVLPFFKKMETYNGNFPDAKYHGSDGPLHIGTNVFSPTLDEWLQAGEELGYKTKDPNGYQTESFFPFETTTKQGTRFSTHRAYLYPVLFRRNLIIRIYSHVTKIRFDHQNRATGVNYIYNDKEYFASAKKEVILSAGALSSPQILMLSGIGPEEHLKSLGIPVRMNLPVGQNLQDHITTVIGPFLVDEGKSFNPARDINLATLHQYVLNGTGPLGSLSLSGGAVISSSFKNSSWPDLLYHFMSSAVTEQTEASLNNAQSIQRGILKKYFKADYGRDAFFILLTLGLPETRGELKLKSTDPLEKVVIDPMYFSHPQDLAAMLEGVKFALKIGNDTNSFKKIGSKLTTTLFPGCEQFGDAHSDDYWKCYLRRLTGTIWHYTSTCRMGKGKNDSNAVVDSSLRVIGIPNLRVIDGSIMPRVSNANTNTPIIMIAEKSADLIKKLWSSENKSN